MTGDFNVNLNKDHSRKNLLETLAKQFGLNIKRTYSNTYLNSELDFILHGSSLEISLFSINNAPSDHKLLVWEISIPCPDNRSLISIPNRRFAENTTRYQTCLKRPGYPDIPEMSRCPGNPDILRYRRCPGVQVF